MAIVIGSPKKRPKNARNTRPRLPEELKTFLGLVKAGRLFDVQKWIADGKPTVFPDRYPYTPMRYAMEMGFSWYAGFEGGWWREVQS